MSKLNNSNKAEVLVSGQFQSIVLPQKFNFNDEVQELSVRRVGRHLILSPYFSDWNDYNANSVYPSNDFIESTLNRKDDELPTETRVKL